MELQFSTHVKMLSGKCYITPAADAKPSIYNPIKDYEKLDKNERSLYRQGMAAFGGVAPTYHIELRERPPLVWDFNSLLLCLQMMFSFMLRQITKEIKLVINPAFLLCFMNNIPRHTFTNQERRHWVMFFHIFFY